MTNLKTYQQLNEDIISSPIGLVMQAKINRDAFENYARANVKDLDVYQDAEGLEYLIYDKNQKKMFLAGWDPMRNVVDSFEFSTYPDVKTAIADLKMKKSYGWANIYYFLEKIKAFVKHETH
jgi:hypothetical protein